MTNTTKCEIPEMDEAKSRKRMAVEQLLIAHDALCAAQNCISNLEGQGFSEIYTEIADAYESVHKMQDSLRRIKPTGIFSEVRPN